MRPGRVAERSGAAKTGTSVAPDRGGGTDDERAAIKVVGAVRSGTGADAAALRDDEIAGDGMRAAGLRERAFRARLARETGVAAADDRVAADFERAAGQAVGARTRLARVDLDSGGLRSDDEVAGDDVFRRSALIERAESEHADGRLRGVEPPALEVVGARAVEVEAAADGGIGEQPGAAEGERAGVEGAAGLHHRALAQAADFRELTGDRSVGELVASPAVDAIRCCGNRRRPRWWWP